MVSTKCKQEYERPRRNHTLRLSNEGIFHLQMISALDGKSQGEIIEEWARAGYAWRLYGNKLIVATRGLISSLERMYLWDLKYNADTFFSKMHGRLPMYSKPYFYIRLAWDKFRINMAACILALAKLLNRSSSR